MLAIERESLADQYEFYACGDAMFLECSRPVRDGFIDKVKEEHAYALLHDGVYRDGSQIRWR